MMGTGITTERMAQATTETIEGRTLADRVATMLAQTAVDTRACSRVVSEVRLLDPGLAQRVWSQLGRHASGMGVEAEHARLVDEVAALEKATG